MSRALVWIRKSKRDDDDIGLEEQREVVPGPAAELADEMERLDLGVHTRFSTMTRDDESGLLDQNERATERIDELRSGRFDYLIALDDCRVCRDEYLRVIQYATGQGNTEIVYVGEVNENDLTFDLKRRIERDSKEEEIEKARRAIERRKQGVRPRPTAVWDDLRRERPLSSTR